MCEIWHRFSTPVGPATCRKLKQILEAAMIYKKSMIYALPILAQPTQLPERMSQRKGAPLETDQPRSSILLTFPWVCLVFLALKHNLFGSYYFRELK